MCSCSYWVKLWTIKFDWHIIRLLLLLLFLLVDIVVVNIVVVFVVNVVVVFVVNVFVVFVFNVAVVVDNVVVMPCSLLLITSHLVLVNKC